MKKFIKVGTGLITWGHLPEEHIDKSAKITFYENGKTEIVNANMPYQGTLNYFSQISILKNDVYSGYITITIFESDDNFDKLSEYLTINNVNYEKFL